MSSADEVLAAALAARVAILAFRDRHGKPMAWPVTPYVDGDQLVVTSTLAYLRKAEHLRADGRVALLVGGHHVVADARVIADPSGDRFVQRLVDQERSKFPPLAQIERVPGRRRIFGWYYGRAHILFPPGDATSRPGDDGIVAISLDALGYPAIVPVPIATADLYAGHLDLSAAGHVVPDGDAVVLAHAEDDTMENLRRLHIRGQLHDGTLTVTKRFGSLAPARRRSACAQLAEQLTLARRGRDGRRRMEAWE